MKLSILLLLLLGICSFSCQSEAANKSEESSSSADLKKALPGTWESISINVDIKTAGNNADSSGVFAIEEENWERKLGQKPIRSYFDYDNKYRMEYRSLQDSIINVDRGIWNVFGDTLMIILPNVTYQYKVEIKNGFSSFRRNMDWDGDGEEDDEYVGVQRYISKGVN